MYVSVYVSVYTYQHTQLCFISSTWLSRLCGLASPQSAEQAGRPETEAEIVARGKISSPRPPFLLLKPSTHKTAHHSSEALLLSSLAHHNIWSWGKVPVQFWDSLLCRTSRALGDIGGFSCAWSALDMTPSQGWCGERAERVGRTGVNILFLFHLYLLHIQTVCPEAPRCTQGTGNRMPGLFGFL